MWFFLELFIFSFTRGVKKKNTCAIGNLARSLLYGPHFGGLEARDVGGHLHLPLVGNVLASGGWRGVVGTLIPNLLVPRVWARRVPLRRLMQWLLLIDPGLHVTANKHEVPLGLTELALRPSVRFLARASSSLNSLCSALERDGKRLADGLS